MRTPIVLALALVASACAGEAPPPGPEMCAGAPFDLCNEEHDCASSICQNFMGEGFQVCSQMCDAATNPCPNDTSGAPATCNNMGICKPVGPNECVR
jgi:hypothetical protein